jgi:molybdate transport system substrate-binding protein
MHRIAALLAGLLLLLAGCGTPAPDSLAVFAAASLTRTFTDLRDGFTGAAVEVTFAGSADLLTQLTQGAGADVFAAADIATMDKAADAGLLAGTPVPFATNTLTIAVNPGNPKGIRSFQDLTRASLVVCAVQVPCGSAFPALQARAGVRLTPVSEESSVTDVLNKVVSGQADAGLVYVTDARAAGPRITAVAFPEAAGAANTYQIAVLDSSRMPALAHRFVDVVTGPTGRRVLEAAGFGPP